MTGRKFAVGEGARLKVRDQWMNAYLLRGQERSMPRRYKEALADFQTAVQVPANLPARGSGGVGARNAEVAYLRGLAYEGLGDSGKATESWTAATAPAQSGGGRRGGGEAVPASSLQSYYQALCLQKLGQADKAKRACSRAWWTAGQLALERPAPAEAGRGGRGGAGQSARFRSANAHYTDRPRVSGIGRRSQGEGGAGAGRRDQPRPAGRQDGARRPEVVRQE